MITMTDDATMQSFRQPLSPAPREASAMVGEKKPLTALGASELLEESLNYFRNYCHQVSLRQQLQNLQRDHGRSCISHRQQTIVNPASRWFSPTAKGGTFDVTERAPPLASSISPLPLRNSAALCSPASPPNSAASPGDADVDDRQPLLAILSYLRKRYSRTALTADVDHSSLMHLEDGDLNEMLERFGRDARNALHKERTRMSLLRDGVKRVNFAPCTESTQPSKQTEAHALLDEMLGSESSGIPSPSTFTSRHVNPAEIDQRHASPKNTSASDSGNTKRGTAATESSGTVKRRQKKLLKEAMRLLCDGAWVTKYSIKSGRAQKRYLWAEAGGALPQLCWGETRSSVDGSRLPLPSLLSCSRSTLSPAVQRDGRGVTGVSGELIPLECCLSLSFEGRSALDVSFQSPSIASEWCGAFEKVIEKNNQRRGLQGDGDDNV